MPLKEGTTVEGKIKSIAPFGAFVELPGGATGLVHISEVSLDYVQNINDYLKEGETVKVKVVSIDDKKKINLSIKKVLEEEKKKMAALEAENEELKKKAEKTADSKKGEDKKEKFSDSQEYADMKKQIADLEASRKEAVVKGVCDKFADIPAGLKDSVQKLAGVLASNTDSFEFSDKDGNKSEKSALDLFSDVISGLMAAPKKDDVTGRVFNPDEFSDKTSDGKETDLGKIAAKM